jgi:DNA-directed RNA polymerase subunit E'
MINYRPAGVSIMVYKEYTVRDIVRIPPDKFDKPINEAAWEELRATYEGMITKNMGIIVSVYDVNVEPEGRIIPGDGATYHDATFKILVFQPFIKEVVEGEVNTIVGPGLFVDLGASDGFVYVGQIADKKVEFDPTRPAMILRDSKRMIERGDWVRARVYNVAPLPGKGYRVQLTMRQPFLGKVEWFRKKEPKKKSGE